MISIFKKKQLEKRLIRRNLLGDRLKKIELDLGGIQRNVKRNTKSVNDNRNFKWYSRGMVGGDKMLQHDYSEIYVAAINLVQDVSSVAEIGILRGHGLAMWSVLFPEATLFGYDIDLKNFDNFYKHLCLKGAFQNKKPILNIYDQLRSDEAQKIQLSASFDIVVDDGLHSQKAIENTFNDFWPNLRSGGVYLIEDIPPDFNTTFLKKTDIKITLKFSEAIMIIKL